MSDLDIAIMERIISIVRDEHRTFWYGDLLCFTYEGIEYKPKYQTIRNKISQLRKESVVEVARNSCPVFYTLKGHHFTNSSTPNHTSVYNINNNLNSPNSNTMVYKFIKNLVFDKRGIHNVRLSFKVVDIWNVLSGTNVVRPNTPKLHKNKVSQDIVIPTYRMNDVLVRVKVHRTNTVTVILGCSLNPILFDWDGINRFTNILAVVQERLRNILDEYNPVVSNSVVPHFYTWKILMWHLNRYALNEYKGKGIDMDIDVNDCKSEAFEISVNGLKDTVFHLYSKQFGNKKRIRVEQQQYPNKTVSQVVEEQLNRLAELY